MNSSCSSARAIATNPDEKNVTAISKPVLSSVARWNGFGKEAVFATGAARNLE